MKIRNKILLYILIPTLIIFSLMLFYIGQKMEEKQKEEVKRKIATLNALVLHVNKEPYWNFDLDSLIENCRMFIETEEIVKIVIRDKDGTVHINLSEDTPDIEYKLAMEWKNRELGFLEIGYSYKNIIKGMNEVRRNFIILIILVFLLIILVANFISSIIYSPVKRIINGLKRVDQGDFLFKLNIKNNDEFKNVEKYFNKMIENLKITEIQNTEYVKELKEQSEELEAAYNQMKSINDTLIATLKDLEISENKYRNIFNYAPDGMLILDMKTELIEEFNREFLNIVNIKTVDIMNIRLLDIFYEDDIKTLFLKLKEEGIVYSHETKLRLCEKDVIISAIPLEFDKNHVQLVIKDVTEVKRLQVKLESYAKSLEYKVSERTQEVKEANLKIKKQQEELVKDAYNKGLIEVTSGIIHNIGNILNIVHLNLAELVEEYPKSSSSGITFFRDVVYEELKVLEKKNKRIEKITQFMPKVLEAMQEFEDKIREQFKFLTKKVAHLKDIVQLQQNFVGTLGTEDYNDLNKSVEEIIELYGDSIEKRDIKLIVNYGKVQELLFDRSQILQVIGNFVKNAYEAIEEAEREHGVLEISTYMKDKNIVLMIKDNGIGIKSEIMEEIFNFGFSTKKDKGKGSGFGLHSSQMIMAKYGGKIMVESEEGMGTEFKILMPIKE